MPLRIGSVVWSVICALALLPTPSAADELRCPGAPIVVVANKSEVAMAAICAPSVWTHAFFAQCGMVQERELTLEVVARVTHPLGLPVIALFDASRWRIKISTFEVTQTLILPRSIYRKLATRDVYDSLIVHEVTHAIFRELVGRRRLPLAAHEYVAYAIQVASLPAKTRDAFLSSFPAQTPKDFRRFNEIYLGMSPLRFAANAYRHLFQDDQYCETIGRVARGEAEFPLPLE